MEWYYVLLIVLGSILLLILLTTYICYKIAFYSNNKKALVDEVVLPNQKIFNTFREQIIQDVTDIRALPYQAYEIKSFDGLTLKAKYYECKKGAPIEIMVHGYRGNGERDLSTGIKRAFLCQRNAFVVDQRGSGSSSGHVLTFGIKERKDCVAWAHFVSQTFGEDITIFLTGISMGAATVLLASSMDLPKNVKGVLADCGYDNASTMIKKVIKGLKLPAKIFYPFVKLGARLFGKFNLEETSPYESVQHSKLPIIFIHGTDDSLVPCQMSRNLYDVCVSKKKLVEIENADHGVAYLVNPELYIKELNDFFNNL